MDFSGKGGGGGGFRVGLDGCWEVWVGEEEEGREEEREGKGGRDGCGVF